MSKKILIGNYKGGVGKTISTVVLASIFARKYKVLMVDLDPQSSLSEIALKNINISLDDEKLYLQDINKFINTYYLQYIESCEVGIDSIIELVAGVYNLYKGNVNNVLDVLPNSLFYKINGIDYGLDELAMTMGNCEKYLFVLSKIFKDSNFDNKYDYIFIDTPPNSNIITQSAFLLSDYLLIPSIMDKISAAGVEHYNNKIKKIYKKHCGNENVNSTLYRAVFGNEIETLGVFETMRTRTEINAPEIERSSLIKKGFIVYDTIIKEISDVVDNTYKIENIINNSINVGEGHGHISLRLEGYDALYNELRNKI